MNLSWDKVVVVAVVAVVLCLLVFLVVAVVERNLQLQQENSVNVEVQEVRYAEGKPKCYLTRVAGRSVLICPDATSTVLDGVKIKEDEGP
mgnify:CR=1 FL=1